MTRQNDERVRPVPIDDDPALVPEAPRAKQRRRRPIAVPLAVLVGTATIAAGALLGIGTATQPDSAIDVEQTPDFSPTAFDPARDSQLLISAAADASGWSVVWDSSPDVRSLGSIGAIPDPVEVSTPKSSADSSTTFAASATCDSNVCGIQVAQADDPTALIASLEATSYTWHSTEPHSIAWTSPTSELVTARIDPETNELIEDERISLPPGSSEILLWDTEGFIVTGEVTVALDLAGAPVWQETGKALDVDSVLATVVRSDDWAIIDRRDGEAAVIVTPAEGLLTVVNAKTDGARSQTTETGYTYSLEVKALEAEQSLPQVTERRNLPITSAAGSEYRIFRGTNNGSITIVYEGPAGPRALTDG